MNLKIDYRTYYGAPEAFLNHIQGDLYISRKYDGLILPLFLI